MLVMIQLEAKEHKLVKGWHHFQILVGGCLSGVSLSFKL
jgi:hypothetical protein